MSYIIECKKLRRTGLILAFFGGGLLAALIPVLNMAFRSEMYITQNEPPLQILLDANWQIMAMLNILLIISGPAPSIILSMETMLSRKWPLCLFRQTESFSGNSLF